MRQSNSPAVYGQGGKVAGLFGSGGGRQQTVYIVCSSTLQCVLCSVLRHTAVCGLSLSPRSLRRARLKSPTFELIQYRLHCGSTPTLQDWGVIPQLSRGVHLSRPTCGSTAPSFKTNVQFHSNYMITWRAKYKMNLWFQSFSGTSFAGYRYWPFGVR